VSCAADEDKPPGDAGVAEPEPVNDDADQTMKLPGRPGSKVPKKARDEEQRGDDEGGGLSFLGRAGNSEEGRGVEKVHRVGRRLAGCGRDANLESRVGVERKGWKNLRVEIELGGRAG